MASGYAGIVAWLFPHGYRLVALATQIVDAGNRQSHSAIRFGNVSGQSPVGLVKAENLELRDLRCFIAYVGLILKWSAQSPPVMRRQINFELLVCHMISLVPCA
jgi:hypothetical protein